MSLSTTKLKSLLSIFFSNPNELKDRIEIKFEVWLDNFLHRHTDYDEIHFNDAVEILESKLGIPAKELLQEGSLQDIDLSVRDGISKFSENPVFSLSHNADFDLARMCYVLCRSIRPHIVVETGVAYGVTSAFILKAFEVNQFGELHSIDLPPLARQNDQFVGTLIPDDLKHRWRLHRGSAKKLLPKILPELGEVDIFIHDSLHTYGNMRFEFGAVKPYLNERHAIIADDIEGNRAFREWVDLVHPDFSFTMREAKENSIFGVSVNRHAHSSNT